MPSKFDDIMGAISITPTETFFVKEWDTDITVKILTKAEHLKLRKEVTEGSLGGFDAAKYDVLVLVYCLVDPELTYEKAVQLLEKTSTATYDMIATRINALNNLTAYGNTSQEAVDKAEESFR